MQKKVSRRMLFIYICLLLAVLGMEAGGLQYHLLLIGREMGINATRMGNLVSVQYLAFILIPLLFGGMGDRYGKKKILIGFGLCFSCGCLILVVSGGFVPALLGVFLIGAGYSICESTGTSLLADVFGDHASRYINWSQSCFSVGALVSPLLGQWMCDGLGLNWRAFFLLLFAMYVVLAIFAASLAFPIALHKNETVQIKGQKETGQTSFSEKSQSRGILYLVILLTGGIMIYAGMENGIAYFMGTQVSEVLLTEKYNSLILSVFWIAMIPSRYIVGVIRNKEKLLLKLSYFGGAVCLALLFAARSLPLLILVYGAMGFFFAPIWPLIMSEAGHLDQQNSGRISGIMVAGCGIGGAVAPTVFGLLADHVGLHASVGFVLAITVIGFVMALSYDRQQKKRTITG